MDKECCKIAYLAERKKGLGMSGQKNGLHKRRTNITIEQNLIGFVPTP